jgi:hypothetical protein
MVGVMEADSFSHAQSMPHSRDHEKRSTACNDRTFMPGPPTNRPLSYAKSQFLLQAISADIQNCPTIPLQIEGTKQL